MTLCLSLYRNQKVIIPGLPFDSSTSDSDETDAGVICAEASNSDNSDEVRRHVGDDSMEEIRVSLSKCAS